ncbi:hypothetical protein GCM10023334_114890 [Nonomuraea thailandensis]
MARSRLQSAWFSGAGILSTENPSRPSPAPNAVSRWAAARSPIQAAWAIPPKPRMVWRRAGGSMTAAAGAARPTAAMTGSAPVAVIALLRPSRVRSLMPGSFGPCVMSAPSAAGAGPRPRGPAGAARAPSAAGRRFRPGTAPVRPAATGKVVNEISADFLEEGKGL